MLTRLATLPARMTWAAVKAAACVVLDDVFGEPDAYDPDGYASTTTPPTPAPVRVGVDFGRDLAATAIFVDGELVAESPLVRRVREWC